MLKEFKKFILRGSLVDLAIGFTVGAAFTTVARSLVDDIIMPPIGLMVGGLDFEQLFWVIKAGVETPPPYETISEADDAGAVTINYGRFINNCLALLLVAIAMFIIIKAVNRMEDELEELAGSPPPKAEPAQKKCPFCLTTIAYRATRCPQCTSELGAVRPPRGKLAAAERQP